MNQAESKDAFNLVRFFSIYRGLIKQRPRLLVAAVALSFAASIAEGVGLAIIYPMLDSVVGSGKLQGIPWDTLRSIALHISSASVTEGLLLLAVVIFFCKSCLMAVSVLTTTLWLNRLQEDWRLAALSHYLYGPYWAIAGERRGKILQNVLGETATAASGAEQLLNFVNKAAFATALIGALFFLNWKLTAALAGMVVVLTVVVRPYILAPMRRLGRKRLGSKQAMMAVTAEPIFAASTIKLLGVEEKVLERLRRAQRKQTRATVLMAVFTKAPNYFLEFIVVVSVAAVFILLARVFGVPFSEAAPLVGAFAVICSRLLTILSSLLNMRLNLETLAPALPLVQALVRSESKAAVVRTGDNLERIASDIEFRNVTFGYREDAPVFANLSVVFPRGKMIGIVGPTGVGKSTLGYLIGRLYEPSAGTIRINDRDIRHFSLESLRRRIGYVEQTPAVFSGTISENIRLGAPEASQADIVEAGRAAGLDDFIMALPEGYETVVHEQGSTLSGGERQRLAIARAIVRHPDVFIFDEGTSALDRNTELAVQKSIQALAGDATVIMIAHRVSTLENAHLIYEVLPGGQVVTRSYQEIAA